MCAWVELDPERHPSDKDGVIRLGGYLVELLSLYLSLFLVLLLLSLAPFISSNNVQ